MNTFFRFKLAPYLHFAFRVLLLLCILAYLAGCSSFKSHDDMMTNVLKIRSTQGAERAKDALQTNLSKSQQKELLYTLELGELLRQAKLYEESNAVWLLAEEEIIAWERTATTNPAKLLSYIGASTINEKMKIYEGQDYEKTWLNTRIAMNHLAMGNWDHARVAIRRTHEREAIIAAFRAKELAKIQEEADKKGWSVSSGEQLGNYPFRYIESPDVLALHNSYQNAFSHYLAGFIYESLGEPGLSAPGYRNAVELSPDSSFLKDGLNYMEDRLSVSHSSHAKQTDVLFVLEFGDAPARKSLKVSLPFFYQDENGDTQSIFISLAFPIIEPVLPQSPVTISLGDELSLEAEPVMNLNLMARRALRDEMPGLIVRGLTRLATKGTLQYQANQIDSLLGAAVSIMTVATEHTDDRIWRTLPGSVLLARGYLEPGTYPLYIDGQNTSKNIDIDGRYAVVSIRLVDGYFLIGDTASYGHLKTSP